MIASLIEKAIREHDSSCQVFSGEPLINADEMEKLTEQKNALILVHNKCTVQADVENVLNLCKRHSINVLGCVAITDI